MELAQVEAKDLKSTLLGGFKNNDTDNFENTAKVIQRESLIGWMGESSYEFRGSVAESLVPNQTDSAKGLSTRLTDSEKKKAYNQARVDVTQGIRKPLDQKLAIKLQESSTKDKFPMTIQEHDYATSFLKALTITTEGYQNRDNRLEFLTALREVKSSLIEKNSKAPLSRVAARFTNGLGMEIGSSRERLEIIEEATLNQLGFNNMEELAKAPRMDVKDVFDKFVSGPTPTNV